MNVVLYILWWGYRRGNGARRRRSTYSSEWNFDTRSKILYDFTRGKLYTWTTTATSADNNNHNVDATTTRPIREWRYTILRAFRLQMLFCIKFCAHVCVDSWICRRKTFQRLYIYCPRTRFWLEIFPSFVYNWITDNTEYKISGEIFVETPRNQSCLVASILECELCQTINWRTRTKWRNKKRWRRWVKEEGKKQQHISFTMLPSNTCAFNHIPKRFKKQCNRSRSRRIHKSWSSSAVVALKLTTLSHCITTKRHPVQCVTQWTQHGLVFSVLLKKDRMNWIWIGS